MTNNSIESVLEAKESTFQINLLNKSTGANYLQAEVRDENTLGQILKEYAADIGVNPNSAKVIFANKRTGDSTSDTEETVEGLGLQDGDVLSICDDGNVAADEESFEIELTNKATGASYSKAAVFGENTLGQVLKGYAADIGVNPNSNKVIFENKRTRASTSDTEETVAGLGLQNGDVLSICDDGGVAADEECFEIDLYNKMTGASYPHVAVFGANTLGQIFKEYAADLGLNPNDSKILFGNKRTGVFTSNAHETVEELGIHAGDVLVFSDNCCE